MIKKSAKLIHDYLLDHALPVSHFADLCGLSRASIHNYLRGKNIHRAAASKIQLATYKQMRNGHGRYTLDFKDLVA